MSRWLVLGGSGQLGRDLVDVLTDVPCVALDLPDVDITDAGSVRRALAAAAPDVVVNAAAYTAVDAAEDDEATAELVNGTAPGIVAQECAQREGTALVHISTDYVFAGDAAEPYPEDAPMAPRSAYGRTKAHGEQAVRAALPGRSYVVRTAWLYGAHGANFAKTMLRLERERDELGVVDDQVGQPTWSHDLARHVRLLVDAGAPFGTYHGTNSGSVSWFGFTREIFRLIGADPDRVQPVTTAAFPRPAARPAFSVLGHDAWSRAGLPAMRPWHDALADALPAIQKSATDPTGDP